jgi:tryptophan synthase
VTYVTAGFPTPEETVDILLGMEAGGAGKYSNWHIKGTLLTALQTSLNLVFPSLTQLLMAQPFKSQIPSVPTWQTLIPLPCSHFIQQALKNGVTVTSVLQMVREARKKGLRAPVLFMGYYNPILSYGEERLLKDCKEAGVNGFIVVDLPPEEAISFRNFCTRGG